MKVRRNIAVIFWVICVMVLLIPPHNWSESIPPVIIFTIIGFVLFFKKPKTKEEKEKLKENKKKAKEIKDAHLAGEHQIGLPLAEGVAFTIIFEADKFSFIGGGNTFNLSMDKITDVCIKTDVELQQQYVSSIGGAVGGAVLFGPIGAMIGGRAKKKETKTLNYYLIFTYLKDGKIDYLCFKVYEEGKARKWIETYHKNKPIASSGTTVDL